MTGFRKALLCIGLVGLLGLQAHAQGWAIQGQAVDSTGRPMPYAKVRVCAYTASGAPCSPLTLLWSDIPQTHSIPNPYTTDNLGNYTFVVNTSQSYIVQIYNGATIASSYLYTAGSSTGGVSQIVAGTNITISPTSGLGAVTINAAGGGIVYASLGQNIGTLCSSFSGGPGTVVISGGITLNVTTNTTIPQNCTVAVLQGGGLNVSSSIVLTFNGPFSAGLYSTFTGSGTEVFGNQSVAGIRPQWWGALGNGTNDDAPAWQSALDTAANSVDKIVDCAPGSYLLNEAINLTTSSTINHNSISVIGEGTRGGCTVIGNDGGIMFDLSGTSWTTWRGLYLVQGSSSPSNAGWFLAGTNSNPNALHNNFDQNGCQLYQATFTTTYGTVCVIMVGSEENTFSQSQFYATTPVILTTVYVDVSASYPSPFQNANIQAAHSAGLNTFHGENSLVVLDSKGVNLVIDGPNNTHLGSMYMANQNFGTPGTSQDAILMLNGTAAGLDGHITDEVRNTLLEIDQGQIFGWDLHVLAGGGLTNADPWILIHNDAFSQRQIENTDITFSYYNPAVGTGKPIFFVSPTSGVTPLVANVNISVNQPVGQYAATVWPSWFVGPTVNSWINFNDQQFPQLPSTMPITGGKFTGAVTLPEQSIFGTALTFRYDHAALSAYCTARGWYQPPTYDGSNIVTFSGLGGINSGSITCTSVYSGVDQQYYPSTGGTPQAIAMDTQFGNPGGDFVQIPNQDGNIVTNGNLVTKGVTLVGSGGLFVDFTAGTPPGTPPASTVQVYAPSSVTAYNWLWPSAADSGLFLGANTAGTVTHSYLHEVDGECALGAGGVWTTGSCGGGGSFTALTGDASSTSTGGATEVLGLLNHALPSLTTGYLNWTGSAWALSAGGGGTTTNALTGAASGGAAPGTTFDGSVARTFDYHTIGAAGLAASNTFTGSTTNDFSGTSQFKLPVAAGYTTAASGEIGHDSTNHNYHAYSNGVDNFLALFPSASPPTSGHLAAFNLSGGAWTLVDGGAAGAVSSVSNSDSSLTVSPTTGAVVTSLNVGHTNNFSVIQDFSAGLAAISDGVHAGIASLVGNTTVPTIPANSFGWLGPNSASFTSYFFQPPATAPSGTEIVEAGTPSSNVSQISYVAAPTGAVVGTTDTQTITNKSIAGSEINSSLVGSAYGGTGVNNTATLTLGSSNQNWGTIGTGIVKVTTTTGAISDAAAADVYGLWSGSCSSSTFLRGDGACATPAGSGTINAASQYDVPYYSAAGSATTVSGAAIAGFQFDSTSGAPVAATATNLGSLMALSAGMMFSGGASAAPVSSADFTLASHTVAGGASAIFDMSAASVTAGLKIPAAAGAAPTADDVIAMNTTTHAMVHGSNGTTIVDAAAATGTGTSTVCSANNWVSTISSIAAPTCTQPAFSNLSSNLGTGQGPSSLTGLVYDTAGTLTAVSTTGSGNAVLATSPTLVTPTLGAAAATSLLATGIVDGQAPVTVTTGSSATLGGTYKSGYTFNQNATAATAITYTLPTAAAGLQYCMANSYNGSAANTGTLEILTSASGQFIIFTDGTLSATGGYVISAGAARDSACVVGVDSTHWMLYPSSGTWTKH